MPKTPVGKPAAPENSTRGARGIARGAEETASKSAAHENTRRENTRRENTRVDTSDTGIDALAVANRLRPVLLRIHRYLRGEAHDLGVTSTQASLLGALLRTPGIGLGELAQQEHMTAPTLVGHIDKLQALGFVERARGAEQDRRRVSLRVTPDGQRALETLRERRTAWLATRLAALAPEELAIVEAAIAPLDHLVRREG